MPRGRRARVGSLSQLATELARLDSRRAELIGHIRSLTDSMMPGEIPFPKAKGRAPGKKRKMSAEGRARIAAAQKKRWAKIRAEKKTAS